MAVYGYYILFAVYGVFLLFTLFSYFLKPRPTGDATVGWALGIFYSAGLAGILLVALLLRSRPAIGFVVLCLPLVWLVLPLVRRKLKDLYARLPSATRIAPLLLRIENRTPAIVHVQLNCWFSTSSPHRASLYRTLDYIIAPRQSQNYQLTGYETGLLAAKSRYVSILLYECVMVDYEGHTYRKEIQPCMQFYEEPIESFGSGNYTLVIDGTKNTPAFEDEVVMLKERGDYGSGVF